jgi:hypothetical protein
MSDKHPADLSEKDLEQLKPLLTQFYEKEWEESYELFTRDIEKLILGKAKDTNEKYRPRLFADLDDLVTSVVLRFAKTNRKLQNAGKKIEKFYGMLNDRVKDVHREWLREMFKPIDSLDDPDSAIQLATESSIDRELEAQEQRRLKMKCQMKCLRSLTPTTRDILVEYCSAFRLPAKERAAAHVELALRLANISAAEATPEQIERKTNNLHSRMSKCRNGELGRCMERCLKRESSRLRRLF